MGLTPSIGAGPFHSNVLRLRLSSPPPAVQPFAKRTLSWSVTAGIFTSVSTRAQQVADFDCASPFNPPPRNTLVLDQPSDNPEWQRFCGLPPVSTVSRQSKKALLHALARKPAQDADAVVPVVSPEPAPPRSSLNLEFSDHVTQIAVTGPATADSANLVSLLNARLGLTYAQFLSKRFHSEFGLGLRAIKFRSLGESVSMKNATPVLADLSVGARYELNPRLSLGLAFAYSQQSIVSVLNDTQASLVNVNVPSVRASLGVGFFEANGFRAGLKLDGGLSFGADASDDARTKSNTSYSGAFFVRDESFADGRWKAEAGFGLGVSGQNNTRFEQSQRDVGLYLKFQRPFGGER